MATYRLFPSTNGPSSNSPYSGPYGIGTAFKVTASGLSLDGYWWWVASTGGSTAAQKFCLWQNTGLNTGTLVTGSTVTSGTMSPGWNFIPLSPPVALTSGTVYKAATAWNSSGGNGFPYTGSYFGTGGAGVGGITNGPLVGFSDIASAGGTNGNPHGDNQCGYQVASSDPTTTYPATGNSSFNGWMDVDVTDSGSGTTATAAVANATAGAANASISFGTTATAQVANANAAAPNLSVTGNVTNVVAAVANATASAPNAAATGGVYTLFQPGTGGATITPPATATASSGNMLSGQLFTVTKGGCWFKGWYLYVCASGGQPTTPQKFALWAAYSQGGNLADAPVAGTYGKLIASATSGTLVPGQWNFVPLPTPVQLSLGGTYLALVGINGPFPKVNSVWNQSGTFPNGVTSGPLLSFSNGGAKYPNPVNSVPWSMPASGSFAPVLNSPYSTAGSDPTTQDAWRQPFEQDEYLFVDVAVTITAPPIFSGTYRIWPNRYDAGPGVQVDVAIPWTMGTEFKLAVPSLVNKIWYFSPTGAASLATEASVWDVSTGALYAGADWASPTWINAITGGVATAGCGWCYADVSASAVTLPPGDYKVTVFNVNGASGGWTAGRQAGYWGGDTNTGPGAAGTYGEAPNGVVSGPITVPVPLGTPPASLAHRNTGNAPPYTDGVTLPGQGTFAQSSPAVNTYPNLYVTYGTPSGNTFFSESFWVDIELTPPGTALATAQVANVSAVAPSASVTTTSGANAVAGVATASATAGNATVTTGIGSVTAIGIVANVAATAPAASITIAGGLVIAVAQVATVVAAAGVVQGFGNVAYFFTPPTLDDTPAIAYYDRAMRRDGTVTSEWRVDRANPLGFRLFQWFKQRPQGVAVYKMSDGTWRSDRAVPGITTQTAWPPVPIGQQVNGAINQSWVYGRMESELVQDPAIVTVYYGGTTYPVSATEAEALIAGGFGAYLTSEAVLS